jgi:hypothetical protein
MDIAEVYCSSYYTLIINNSGELSMFGTLKGFAKFLFDSPSKDNSGSHDQAFKKLDLKGEKISKVTVAERCFAVYTTEKNKLYVINENFKPQ